MTNNQDLEELYRNFNVYNLDTGERVSVETVNADVLQRQPKIKSMGLRSRLIAFFQKHDIDRIDEVDNLMEYGGFTSTELWENIQAQYRANQRERITALFREHCPQRLNSISKLLRKHQGREEDLILSTRKSFEHHQTSTATQQEDVCTWKPGSANAYQQLPTMNYNHL